MEPYPEGHAKRHRRQDHRQGHCDDGPIAIPASLWPGSLSGRSSPEAGAHQEHHKRYQQEIDNLQVHRSTPDVVRSDDGEVDGVPMVAAEGVVNKAHQATNSSNYDTDWRQPGPNARYVGTGGHDGTEVQCGISKVVRDAFRELYVGAPPLERNVRASISSHASRNVDPPRPRPRG